NAEATCGALQVALLRLQRQLDRSLSGDAGDLAQVHALRQRIAQRTGEMLVGPTRHRVLGRQLVLGQIADGQRARTHVTLDHARSEVPQLAHVPWIGARLQKALERFFDARRGEPRPQLTREMLDERHDVLGPLAQGWHTTDPGGDAMEEVAPETATGHL